MHAVAKWFLGALAGSIVLATVAFLGYHLHNDVRTERMYQQCLEAQKSTDKLLFCNIPR